MSYFKKTKVNICSPIIYFLIFDVKNLNLVAPFNQVVLLDDQNVKTKNYVFKTKRAFTMR